MQIFTDGSVAGRIAGISFVLTDNDYNIILVRKKPVLNIDNNSAELQAILFALEELPNAKDVFPPKPGETPQETAKRIEEESKITVFTDSTYAQTRVEHKRQARDCDKKTMELIDYHLVTKNCSAEWIKGHRNDGTKSAAFNRLAHHMARKAGKLFAIARKYLKEMNQMPSSPEKKKEQERQNPPKQKLIAKQQQQNRTYRVPPSRRSTQGRGGRQGGRQAGR